MVTLGFDIYGTLIDTAGIATALERHVGDRAHEFARVWREKQLEYVFRRGMMRRYVDFAVCTRHALDYCCLSFEADLAENERQELMATYRELPAYPDALQGIRALSETSARLFVYSMGRPDDVWALLERASLKSYFEGYVSVGELETYKPNPEVYDFFLRETGASAEDAWLVSGNPFDVTGAVSAGINGAWVRRSADAVFDPWEITPTVTVDTVGALVPALDLSAVEV